MWPSLSSIAVRPSFWKWFKAWNIFDLLACYFIVASEVLVIECFISSMPAVLWQVGSFLALASLSVPLPGLHTISEMAHPSFRGVMTAIYNTFYFVGAIPGTFIPYGTSTTKGTKSWRIPTWIQMTFSGACPAILLAVARDPSVADGKRST